MNLCVIICLVSHKTLERVKGRRVRVALSVKPSKLFSALTPFSQAIVEAF
jgi:hypothetical protein